MNDTPQYLTTEELAELRRTSPAAIHTENHRGTGPPAYKCGKRVLYRLDEVLAWIEEHRVTRHVS